MVARLSIELASDLYRDSMRFNFPRRGRNGKGEGERKCKREEAQHSRHLGRRHRHLEPELLHARADGLPHAEHRPAGAGRHAVHRQLRRAVVHSGALVFHYRPERRSHGSLQGRHSRRADRHERQARDHRGAAEGAGLCHRAIRQEPPRRPEPHAADEPRLRRVLRQPVPPERRGRARDGQLPQGAEVQGELRTARRASIAGPRTRTTRR